jgi:hypothetical protein
LERYGKEETSSARSEGTFLATLPQTRWGQGGNKNQETCIMGTDTYVEGRLIGLRMK